VSLLTPSRLEEALASLAAARDARPPVPLAGGTDLLVQWPERLEARERDYIDLTGLAELGAVRWEKERLELGALATYWDVVTDARARDELPILVDAARQVGAIQIQSRGTWAGNVANASPAADGVPVLMACDATLVLGSAAGRREVALDAFYTGYRESVLEPDELILAIRVPRRPRSVQAFVKVGPRRAQAIAKVGLAATRSDDGWRVVAASVAPVVRRCPVVEALLDDGAPLDGPDDLLPALRQDVAPIDDLRSTAAYRERVLSRVLWDVVRQARA